MDIREKVHRLSKKALYDSIVEEVKADITLIKPLTQGYEEAVQGGGTVVTLPQSIAGLTAPVSAFADYDVRDALILNALEDESFAFVLIAKVGGAVYQNQDNVTQDDVEALAVVANVSAMWEQTENAYLTLEVIKEITKDKGLEEPTLAQLTKRILDTKGFPAKSVREGAQVQLSKIVERINTNTDGGE